MASREMRHWDAGDFGRMFKHASEKPEYAPIKDGLSVLGDALASLEDDFCRATAACGSRLANTMDELHSIGRRLGYCERPSRWEKGCRSLGDDLDRATSDVNALHEQCFL